MIALNLDRLSHRYNRVWVFEDITLRAEQGAIVGCIGRNGSGKSTLLRIIAGLQSPSRGTITVDLDGLSSHSPIWRRRHTGYCAPNLVLYDELTISEHIAFHAACREFNHVCSDELLDDFGLYSSRTVPISELSSGMKQRLQLLLAFMYIPPLLVLDEPTATLDQGGIEVLKHWVSRVKDDSITFIATNSSIELHWCTHILDLEERQFSHAFTNVLARAVHE